MLRCVFVFLCISLVYVQEIHAFKILGVFPYPGKSHHYVFDPIMVELAKRGHEVTVVSHFPQKAPQPNLTDIHITDKIPGVVEYIDLNIFSPRGGKMFTFDKHLQELRVFFDLSSEACRHAMNSKKIEKILESDQTYDVIILEQFNSDCSYAFSHKFKAPVVGIASHIIMSWTYARFGLSDNPSYVPSHYLGYGFHPNFLQRVDVFLVNNFYKLVYRFQSQGVDIKTIRRGLPDMPDLEEIARNSTFLLVNAFAPLTGPRPLNQNVIEIGGVHVGKSKPLSVDLEKFISEAVHGVVYVSFGSMVRASSMPEDKLKAFLDAFSEIPQKVLLKWENDTLPGAPPNVFIKKWMPQLDILSHRNVKAFISHGGMLGTTEAIHTGVPMMTIPLFGDQFANSAAVKESGLGLTVMYEDITKENILNTLKQLLDPKMYANAKRLSQIWQDRPMSPMDTAIYWIEYVARYGGAPHLRSAAIDLPLYQYLLLDVIAFLGLISFIILYINYRILKFLLSLCCATKKSGVVPEKIKNKKSKKE